MAKSLLLAAETRLANQVAKDAESSDENGMDDLDEEEIAQATLLLDGLDGVEELLDTELVKEAAEPTITAYDLLQQHVADAKSRIVLPDHLRLEI